MTREEFDILVLKLCEEAKGGANRIRRKAQTHIVYGYFIYCLLLTFSSLMFVGALGVLIISPSFVSFKIFAFLGIPAGALVYSLTKAIIIKFEPPRGYEMAPDESTEIINLVSEILKESFPKNNNSLPIDKVIITFEFNAAVSQLPSLGILGFYKNYLVIGLPLLQYLSRAEIKSILAHELAHLYGNHGKMGSWIYRTRITWDKVIQSLNNDNSWNTKLVSKFLRWFWPRLNAYSFALSREQEYEADRYAASATNTQIAAGALMKAHSFDIILDECWQKFDKLNRSNAEAPKDTFDQILSIGKDIDYSKVDDDLSKALKIKTDTIDTHPCLFERLTAIGFIEPSGTAEQVLAKRTTSTFPVDTENPNALESLISQSHLKQIVNKFNQEWHDNFKEEWKLRFEELQSSEKELERLQSRKNKMDVTDDDQAENAIHSEVEGKLPHLLELMKRLHQTENYEETFITAKKVLEIDSQNAIANYYIGVELLKKNDNNGIQYLDKFLAENPFNWDEYAEILYNYYRANGKTEELTQLKIKCDEFDRKIEIFNKERSELNLGNGHLFRKKDSIISHNLSPKDLASIVKQLEKQKHIKSAFAVQKVTSVFTNIPTYVLTMNIKFPFFTIQLSESEGEIKIIEELYQQIELETFSNLVIVTKKQNPSAFKYISKDKDNLIYLRKKAK